MSGVPASRRGGSRFEAQHHFYKLRDEVTMLVMNDFGYSADKDERRIEKYQKSHSACDDVDRVVERWKTKKDAFEKWFIDDEGAALLNILRSIESEFTFGNSIYPSDTPAKMEEFNERRKHIDAAIAYCYVLKQEIQYIIRTLPVDLNKYTRFAELIDEQIDLYKGVRKSDNRFLNKKNRKKKSDAECVQHDNTIE